jgi:capsular exopolysaccharide synthesis family protein
VSATSEVFNRQKVIEDLQSRIKVIPRDGTKLVDIAIKSYDSVEAAQLVNTIAEAYVQKNLDDKLDTSRKAKEWLGEEAESLRKTIQQAEQTLHNYKEEKQIIVDPSMNKIIVPGFDVLKSLQEAYTEKKRERILLRSEINELRSVSRKFHHNFGGFNNDDTLIGLKKKIIDLRGEYVTSSKKLGTKHPKMVDLSSEIDELEKTIEIESYREIQQVITNIENKYNAVLAQEHELKELLDVHKRTLIRAEKDITEYESLKHGLEINKKMYGEVSRRLAETTLTTAITANNVKLVERAIAGAPVSSEAIIKLLIGLIVGLGCGGALAFIAEYRDTSFKNSSEAEHYLGLPFLGFLPHHTLPKRDRLASPRLVTLQEPWAPASESYRGIRTWVQLSQTPVKTLLIASAFPREGRSITAANLAVSFAQLGHRVLLIDADLRQSSIHRCFGLDNTKGLSSLLESDIEWQSVLNDSPLANLKVLTAGTRPLNPTELLSTTRMKRLMASCKMCFDTIIYDVPMTFSSIPDAAILAPHMDGVLLVYDPAQVDRAGVLEAKKMLERTGANLLGVIFNNVKTKHQKRYYAYHAIPSYAHGEMHAAQGWTPDLTCIDMRPIESPKPWIVDAAPSLIPIAKSAHSDGLTFTLHTMVLLGRVDGVAALTRHVFLLLELEITNDSISSHFFDPTLTAVSLLEDIEDKKTPILQTTGINGEHKSALHTTHVYHYDAPATHSADGFANMVEIPPQYRHKGMIVYQIKGENNQYVFEYKNSNINIVIDFTLQSQSSNPIS